MSDTVKLKINLNEGTFTYDGPLGKLDSTIEKFSKLLSEHQVEGGKETPSGDGVATATSNKQVRKKPSASSSKPKDNTSSFDHMALANSIKDDPRFDNINKKVILVPKDLFNKCKFVLSMTETKLTSGDIHRVLNDLSIKCDISGISRALSNNRDKFIVDDTGTKKYGLSAPTREQVENWINETSGE